MKRCQFSSLALCVLLAFLLPIRLSADKISANTGPFSEYELCLRSYAGLYRMVSGAGGATQGRGLDQYRFVMGQWFKDAVERLSNNPDAHWFDAGAGDMQALQDFIKEQKKMRRQVPRLSAAVYNPTVRPRGIEVFDKLIEELDFSKIKPVDLITDLYGALAYSLNPDVVLQKYLDALSANGEILVSLGEHLQPVHGDVRLLDGTIVSFLDWLKSIPGIQVEHQSFRESKELGEVIASRSWHDFQFDVVRIRRIPGEEPRVPRLSQFPLFTDEDGPPNRLLSQVGNIPLPVTASLSPRTINPQLRVPWLRPEPVPRRLYSMEQGHWLQLNADGTQNFSPIVADREGVVMVPARAQTLFSRAKPNVPESWNLITGTDPTFARDLRPDVAILRYFNLLADGGVAEIQLDEQTMQLLLHSDFYMENAQRLPLIDYLLRVNQNERRGLSIYLDTEKKLLRIWRKPGAEEPRFPSMQMIGVKNSSNPMDGIIFGPGDTRVQRLRPINLGERAAYPGEIERAPYQIIENANDTRNLEVGLYSYLIVEVEGVVKPLISREIQNGGFVTPHSLLNAFTRGNPSANVRVLNAGNFNVIQKSDGYRRDPQVFFNNPHGRSNVAPEDNYRFATRVFSERGLDITSFQFANDTEFRDPATLRALTEATVRLEQNSVLKAKVDRLESLLRRLASIEGYPNMYGFNYNHLFRGNAIGWPQQTRVIELLDDVFRNGASVVALRPRGGQRIDTTYRALLEGLEKLVKAIEKNYRDNREEIKRQIEAILADEAKNPPSPKR